MPLIICPRCDYPKDETEPENTGCIGHVSMADIYIPMIQHQD